MTRIVDAFTFEEDSKTASAQLTAQLCQGSAGSTFDAVILFASPRYDYEVLLQAILDTCRPKTLIGCSSAGEFVQDKSCEGGASAIGISSDEMVFSSGFGSNINCDCREAAQQVARTFIGREGSEFAHRSAIILADALSGRTEELIEELTAVTGGTYKFFGGGAGDDARFATTHVFNGNKATTNAVVALEILSKKPIGVGVAHGWLPGSTALRVTESEGNRLIGINAIPAVDIFEEHAAATSQTFDRTNPVPFFLHNVIGIHSHGGFKLRVPLAIAPDGSVICASDVPQGSTIHIMKSGNKSAEQAAADAVATAQEQIHPVKPAGAIFFDCVATRLRLGSSFKDELNSVKHMLGDDVPYVGCNTYGQIARAENQFSGFHNCTAVVCLIPA